MVRDQSVGGSTARDGHQASASQANGSVTSASVTPSARARGAMSKKLATEAQEAELLSQATSQAMIAARSILLSGGSQATALSTAKAAAQSILMPAASVSESSGLGRAIMNRRKAKRQADVVASMAYLSVKNSIQPAMTQQEAHLLEANNFMNLLPSASPSQHQQQPLSSLPMPRGGHPSSPPPSEANSALTDPMYSSGEMHLDGRSPSRRKRSDFRKNGDRGVDLARLTHQGLPADLPKNKNSKTRDLATAVPDQDPIYYTDTTPQSSQSFTTGSDERTDDSFTYASETIVDGEVIEHVPRSSSTKPKRTDHDDSSTYIQTGVLDPFFATLNAWFFCGPTSGPHLLQDHTLETRNDDHDDSDADTEEDVREKAPVVIEGHDEHLQKVVTTNNKAHHDSSTETSSSSVNSTALLKELDSTSSDDDDETKDQPMLKSSIRESVEQVVLRALSSAGLSETASKEKTQTGYHRDKLTITLQHKPSQTDSEEVEGTLDDDETEQQHDVVDEKDSEVSSLTAPQKNRLYTLSQRVKFRRWLRGRRQPGVSETSVE